MPTPKNKKVTPSRQSQWRRKSLWLVVVLLILAASGLGALVIQHNKKTKAIEADRARFSRVDKDVRSVASEIVKNTQPVQNEINQECTYQSRKFEAEPLICSVTFRALYGVENLLQANDVTDKISEYLQAQPTLFTFRGIIQKPDTMTEVGRVTFTSLPLNDQAQNIGAVFSNIESDMECQITHEFFKSQNTPYYYQDYFSRSEYSIVTTLYCKDYAKAQFFTLAD